MIEKGSPKANQNPKMTTNHVTHFVYVQRRLKKLDSCQTNNEADLNSFPFFFLLEYLTSPKKKTQNSSLFFNEFKERREKYSIVLFERF